VLAPDNVIDVQTADGAVAGRVLVLPFPEDASADGASAVTICTGPREDPSVLVTVPLPPRQVVVAPHFAEFRLQPSLVKMVTTRPQLLGIGIDEATALEVHGEVGTVLGRGHVTIVTGANQAPQVLAAGARYDLGRRAVL